LKGAGLALFVWITADLGDGLWDESIQTTTLVIVSTLIALILVFRWEFLLLEVKQLM
jgi:ABC-type proline/glycine betaine transport system permease subunit